MAAWAFMLPDENGLHLLLRRRARAYAHGASGSATPLSPAACGITFEPLLAAIATPARLAAGGLVELTGEAGAGKTVVACRLLCDMLVGHSASQVCVLDTEGRFNVRKLEHMLRWRCADASDVELAVRRCLERCFVFRALSVRAYLAALASIRARAKRGAPIVMTLIDVVGPFFWQARARPSSGEAYMREAEVRCVAALVRDCAMLVVALKPTLFEPRPADQLNAEHMPRSWQALVDVRLVLVVAPGTGSQAIEVRVHKACGADRAGAVIAAASAQAGLAAPAPGAPGTPGWGASSAPAIAGAASVAGVTTFHYELLFEHQAGMLDLHRTTCAARSSAGCAAPPAARGAS